MAKGRQRKSASTVVELIVRRGALRRFDRLKAVTAGLPVKLSWDRRVEERRRGASAVSQERRHNERRGRPPFTWELADFIVITKRRDGR
ncbi:MAG TPA: hypothetical protein VNI78_02335 [Vicinamibacterales bacterium]|nr:hypothetical protein [Vicinamibacterales bacterium]